MTHALGTNPFSVYFSLNNGLSDTAPSLKRHLSNMKGMYADGKAQAAMLEGGDPLLYEFYDLGVKESEGSLAFGTSIVYPGKVGDEYYMTKGHYHTIRDTAEVYYCIGGRGFMLMENEAGDWIGEPFTPGKAVYVPGGYAHRSINTGTEPLITFYVFRSDAGHDYGSIETKGFRKIVVERDGAPAIIDNPHWT
ncbi:glucose-6-phosphate isomerase [Paenibacillus phyllosphaerae]|uniref:glucose-6-phosphate isomerase n=1 Tax=Paenibacillus phyllosphaerae TaxID=274593 RepID=A0A7W5FNE3_9BACL|nr:glucose-6-phosphate isomerase [Paenibacillus phyllosphaerae]MBB3111042.1 glucose-6-phosphate isomerase [Paenibacillus phyllosphaerae]